MASPDAAPPLQHRDALPYKPAPHTDVLVGLVGNRRQTVRTSTRRLAVAPHHGTPVAVEDGHRRTAAKDAPVTTEEVAILALLGSGLALDTVATRVALSPRTVSRRLRSICDRLGVAHPIQAIVWAAHRGLI